jgi:PAS domain S-box-containing protein
MSKILVVDDKASERQFLVTLIRHAGHSALEAENGRDALAMMSSDAPDLVITDLVMPTVDGFEFARRLREQPKIKNTPVILYSASYDEPATRTLAAECPGTTILPKPAEPEVILETITNTLAQGPSEAGQLREDFSSAHLELLNAKLRQKMAGVERYDSALRASERQFRQLAESIPQLVWMTDAYGGVIYLNRRCCEQLGLMGHAQLGGGWRERIHPEDRQRYLTNWRQALETGEDYQIECRYRLSDNGYRWFLERAIPVRDDHGNIKWWFGTSTDIHQQKQSQEDLERANRILTRSNEMLEQFAYIASHDLQEPLRTMSNFVELLGERYRGRLDETADQYIQFVSQAAGRARAMIEDLLKFSRAGRCDAQLAPLDIQHIIDEVLISLQTRIEETGASVNYGSLPTVRADRMQISQLFQNLIENALKYRKKEVPPEIRIWAERQGQEWVIAIQDNGIGIDPRHTDQIFRLFNRLHRADYPGTGIGLSICQKIVDRHGGRIWAEGAIGRGSTFYFTLPGESLKSFAAAPNMSELTAAGKSCSRAGT